MIRPPTRTLLIAALAAALAACNQSQPDRQFSTDADSAVTSQFVAGQTLSAPITSANDAPTFAVLALPADAGKPGKLTEKQFVNGWRQSTSLDGKRTANDWNDLSIDIQSQDPGDATSNLMRLSKPTQEGIRREILARFHGVPMRIVTRPMYNALGPFGLAVGAGPGSMRCAFAWQWLANLPAAARGEKANFFNSGEMAALIRMRLCRSGVTADKLAEWYEGLKIADQANVARIVEALKQNTDAQTVAGGVQVVDNSDSLEATLIGSRRAEAESIGGGGRAYRRHARHHRRAPADDAPEAPAPLTTPSSPSAARRPERAFWVERRRFRPGAGQSRTAGPGLSGSCDVPRGHAAGGRRAGLSWADSIACESSLDRRRPRINVAEQIVRHIERRGSPRKVR